MISIRRDTQQRDAAMAYWQRRAFNISQMRRLAEAALPKPVFDFADGGAEDERTLQRNENDFSAYRFLPQPLRGAGSIDLTTKIFGTPLSMPLMIGPTGLAGLFWPDGERATARAAARAGTIYCLSHGSVCRLEDLNANDIGPRWMQVFIYRDRGFTRELAERAAAANYGALILTVDNQYLGRRERDLVNGFSIPPRFGLFDLIAMAGKAGWMRRMIPELPRITFGNYVRAGEASDIKTLAGRMQSLLDPDMSWADVDQLRKVWKGPLIIKGLLHPDDAREAINHGVDGIIVSNHGGRQLDDAISGVAALPAIVNAVQGQMPIMVDGGFRRGSDIIKAVALGAAVCLIGRPHLWGVSVAGEAGVTHVLELYRQEMTRVMGLLGAKTLHDLGPQMLVTPQRS